MIIRLTYDISQSRKEKEEFIVEAFLDYMDKHETLKNMGLIAIKIIVLFIVIRIGISLFTRMTYRILRMHDKMEERRKKTLEILFANLIKYVMYFVFLLTVLPIFGIHIGALLAGAGVAGIAVAFAAQSLLKDFFNGFFFIIEDQFGVGDYVVINGVWGSVKSVGLRTTRIQVWTGQVEIIPNGEIKQVTNYSKENSLAVLDIKVGYNTEMAIASSIIEKVMNDLKDSQENIVGNVSVLGVQELNDSTYTIRAIAECKPYTHWGIQRLAKQHIHTAFTQNHIDLPLSKVVFLSEPHHELLYRG